ncbi:MAG TPA: DUF2207 domain-containing protein [Bacillota bacterium]|nr:DUF2207 domain-containing protein [Bacillota bacterium]
MKFRRIIAVAICAAVLFGLNITFASAAEAYTTKAYDVQMDVSEDNSFVVKEDIKVDFSEARHGIYRYIPYKGTTTRQVDGRTVLQKYRMKISNVKVEGYNFDTYTENGNLVIRIGSEDLYVNGPQEYRISYRCTLYDDENEAFDSLYWNILSNGWPTPVESSRMIIHMPKKLNQSMIEFIAGRYGEADTEAIDWSVDGSTITADTTRVIGTGEGVTLNIVLPEGYFVGERTTAWMQWLMLLIIVAAPLLSCLLWLFFGRDPKVVRTVEFYPPEGVTPAEMGDIIDGAVDSKDIVSLIIYWANGGYLTIRDDGDGQFTLIKEKDLPPEVKTYEYTMFQGLFNGRDQVSPDDLKGDFYPTFEVTKRQLRTYFSFRENRIFTHSSLGARALGVLLMLAPALSLSAFGAMLNKGSDTWIVAAVLAILLALAGFSAFISAYDRKESNSRGKTTGLYILGYITLIISGLGMLIYSSNTLNNPLPGFAVILASAVSLIFTMRMKQRTKKSASLLGKVLGFKEFIRTAELDRIKRLVDEKPDYFYNVLPYAYVFGLTDKWAKKFEKIDVAPPAWYNPGYGYGYPMFNTWVFMNSFNHYTSAIQQNISIPPAPSGGGSGFSGGGGFSSGGGFSGGGMGGGGGGSW